MDLEKRQELYNRFKPIIDSKGNIVAQESSNKFLDFICYFYGDKDNLGQYIITKSPAPFHGDIVKDMFQSIKLYWITCPSNFGKSTIITKLYTIYSIIYFHEPYTLIASGMGDIAEGMLDDIRILFTENEKILAVYGDPQTTIGSIKSNKKLKDSAKFLEFGPNFGRAIVRCISWRSNGVRGSVRRGQRVTLFIGDDPESIEDCRTKDRHKHNLSWLNRDVIPRLDFERGRARIIGNLLSSGCMLAKIMLSQMWKGSHYSCLEVNSDGVEKSLFPSKFPTKVLQKLRSDLIADGRREEWDCEWMNIISEAKDKNIKGYDIHKGVYERHAGTNVLIFEDYPNPVPVNIYVSIDPAFGRDESLHDPRAIVTFAKGRVLKRNGLTGDSYYHNMVWILEEEKNWDDPAAVIDRLFELHRKYYLTGFVIEAISGQQILQTIYEMKASSDFFIAQNPLNEIFPKYQPPNKKMRIWNSLQSLCRLGSISIGAGCKLIREEMDTFQHIENPNLLDAVEFGIRFTETNTKDPNTTKENYHREQAGYSQYAHKRPKRKSDFRQWGPSTINSLRV